MGKDIIIKPKVGIWESIKPVLFSGFNLLSLSKDGLRYLIRKVKNETISYREVEQIDDAKIESELKKVETQSNEFKNKAKLKEAGDIYRFTYVAKTDLGEIKKGNFEGPSFEAVKLFLENEYAELLLLKQRDKWDIDIDFYHKMSANNLAFFLTQLATYIRAGITLVDGMRIMVKQTSSSYERKIYEKIVFSLVGGDNFSKALGKQEKVFPVLLISMVKTAELTGDLPSVLDEMADYYTKIDNNRRALTAALTYPIVIAIVAIGAVVFLLLSVVPKFQEMFASIHGKLPQITVFVLTMSKILQEKGLIVLSIFAVVLFAFIWFYKNNRTFRKQIQILMMKTPVFGDIIIYNEVSNLTRTFATLLNHGVFITDSMEILSAITNNEVYKTIIYRSLIGLSKGAKISETFKGEWAFPVVAYEMLVTGESTGQLGLMMEKVSKHYSDMHESKTTTLKSLMEPFIIIFLAVVIGFILLSVIIPMFSLYNQI